MSFPVVRIRVIGAMDALWSATRVELTSQMFFLPFYWAAPLLVKTTPSNWKWIATHQGAETIAGWCCVIGLFLRSVKGNEEVD